MHNFLFNTTKSILYGAGSSNKLSTILKSFNNNNNKQNILLVTDKELHNIKLYDKLLSSLINDNYNVNIYSNVIPDPSEDIINDATNFSKETNSNIIIGFGGGSSMDVAKVVSYLSYNEDVTINDIYGVDQCFGNRLPLIQIPTTAGTGSEVTPISIITTGESEKKGIVSSLLLPDYAVLDGSLTISLPSHITAATGIDAMVHAIEAYTSKIKKNPLSDIFAKEGLKLLGKNINYVCSVEGCEDADARSAMLLGSLYAGMAFANSPVGAVHALAYPIGSHFHIPHGLSNSLMLPHVLRFNSERLSEISAQSAANTRVCAQYYAELGNLVFGTKFRRMYADEHSNGKEFARLFEELAVDLKLPTRLRDVKIDYSNMELLAKEAMKQTRLLPNNIREVTYDDALMLYDKAF